MDESTKIAINTIFHWQVFETPVCWAIYNGVVARVFNLPHLAYWEVMVLLILVGCLFPSGYALLLAKITDKLHGQA